MEISYLGGKLINYIHIFVGLVFLLIGAITDFKKREVPDFVSYSFWFVAIVVNLILAFFYNNYWIFINSIAGFILAFILGLILFYTGQWGGGDTKFLIGVFTLIGVNVKKLFLFSINIKGFFNYLLSAHWFLFLVNLLIAGAIIGIFYSIFILIRNYKKIKKSLKVFSKNKIIRKIKKIVFSFSIFIILLGILKIVFSDFKEGIFILLLGVFPLFFVCVWLLAKVIDSCMNKKVLAKKVTVGDWIMKDVFVNRKTKNILFSAFNEFNMSNEKQISFDKFKKKFSLKFAKFKSFRLFFRLLFNSNLKKDFIKDFSVVLSCSSKKRLKMNIKKSSFFVEKDNDLFLEFLNKENIYFNKYLLCGFQNTGLTELQLKKILELYKKKKLKYLIVKEGIPFIPAFLIGFCLNYLVGFWWLYI